MLKNVIIMGDLNAKIDQKRDEANIGKFRLRNKSTRRQMLIN